MNAASPRQPDLVRTADRVIAPTYTRPPVVFEDGDGCWLRSQGGDRYLDLTTGIAVTSLGHGNATVRDALHEAADGLLHTSNLFHTAAPIRLARALTDRSFAEQVFFCNSGAEANEAAIKLARKHAHEVLEIDEPLILTAKVRVRVRVRVSAAASLTLDAAG